MEKKIRCEWVGEAALYQSYHDKEWGVPVFDARQLFEALCLESQQAGLAWWTVLKKREGYRQHFFQFDPEAIVQLNAQDIDVILQSNAVIRHRAKLEAIVSNARAYLQLFEKKQNFVDFIWHFVDGVPIVNSYEELKQVPSTTKQSDYLARELKKYGFNFIGPKSCYAFMQAVGLVNDHLMYCHCRTERR